MTPPQATDRDVPTNWGLFTAFLKIGMLGFGGVAAFARHVLVVEREMLNERDFAESFGVASTLPGANTVNLASMLGDRWRGPMGAFAAVSGLVGAPLLILVGILVLYQRWADVPDLQAGVAGAAAAAAGLVIGTSLKLLKTLNPDLSTLATFGAVFVAAALLRIPMALILLVSIPLVLALLFARQRRA